MFLSLASNRPASNHTGIKLVSVGKIGREKKGSIKPLSTPIPPSLSAETSQTGRLGDDAQPSGQTMFCIFTPLLAPSQKCFFANFFPHLPIIRQFSLYLLTLPKGAFYIFGKIFPGRAIGEKIHATSQVGGFLTKPLWHKYT